MICAFVRDLVAATADGRRPAVGLPDDPVRPAPVKLLRMQPKHGGSYRRRSLRCSMPTQLAPAKDAYILPEHRAQLCRTSRILMRLRAVLETVLIGLGASRN